MIPGEYRLASGDIAANVNRKTVRLEVVNRGDRPIQVGSHYGKPLPSYGQGHEDEPCGRQ